MMTTEFKVTNSHAKQLLHFYLYGRFAYSTNLTKLVLELKNNGYIETESQVFWYLTELGEQWCRANKTKFTITETKI